MKRISLLVTLGLACVACSPSGSSEPVTINKAGAFGAKADTNLQSRICRELGYPADCDVCQLAGWYRDGECDTFCNKPDPDCGTQCQDDLDCPQIFCITSPCPQNVCIGGICEQQNSNQCFGAWIDQAGGCRSANDGVAPAECCSCDGATENVGWPSLCVNKHDVTVDYACCENSQDAGAPDPGDASMPGDCYVGGCSGQVCSDDPNVFTTCEWRPEYACYFDATCERQADGLCAWTDTPELQRCIDGGGPDKYDPCENKKCGDSCTVCPPNDPACTETAVLKSCDEYGSCTAGAPQCSPQDDCRTQGCSGDTSCQFCWTSYACIPNGAVC